MKLKRLSFCVGVALVSMQAHAADIQFSGFGSVIAGVRDHDMLEDDNFSVLEAPYAGYTNDKFSLEPDSLVGLQARADINEKASVTIQLLSEGADDWQTNVDMAYLSYQVTDQLTWRAGRMRAPFFLYSDFVNVGYAYPWIRPPFEVYSSPFNSLDGMDVVYRTSFGTVDAMFQAYVGSDNFVIDENFGSLAGFPGRVDNMFGLVAEFNWRDFKLRYAYSAADVTIQNPAAVDTLSGGLQMLSMGLQPNPVDPLNLPPIAVPADAGAVDTIDRLVWESDYNDFHDLALMYDNGSLLAIIETTTATAQDEAPGADEFQYYATLGYRISDFTLAVTYAIRDDDAPDLSQDLDAANPVSQVYIAGIDGVAESLTDDSDTVTLSFRWDFSPGVAFKAEVIDFKDNKDENNDTMITRTGVQFVF